MKKVALIGAGNINWHLGQCLPKKHYDIIQVYSRTRKSAQALGRKLLCKSTTRLDKIEQDADIILIAISDDALAEVVENLKYLNSPDRLFIHTSGSTPLQILEQSYHKCGVLWPPQSIRKENKINISKTPFVVVCNDHAKNDMMIFAKHVSKNIHILSEEQKGNLHLAAVLANNFTTHLLSLAYRQCVAHKIDFKLLKPIIEETTNRISDNDPRLLQTGPAIRGDIKTIERHLNLIKKNKDLKKLYKLLSTSINPRIK